MLTQRTMVTRGETFIKQLELDDANLTRDAIVKSLYEVQFRLLRQEIHVPKENETRRRSV